MGYLRSDKAQLLHEYALWCAEEALEAERQDRRLPNPESLAVLEVKRQWLDGTATDDELSVARKAAERALSCGITARNAALEAADPDAGRAAQNASYRAAVAFAGVASGANSGEDSHRERARERAGTAATRTQIVELIRRMAEA